MRKIFLFFSFLLAVAFSFSCTNETAERSNASNSSLGIEEAAKSLGFVSLDEQIGNQARTRGANENTNDEELNQNKDEVTVFRARVARPKDKCEKGFGLCDIILIGIKIGPQSDYNGKIGKQGTCSALVEKDLAGGSFVELEVAKDPATAGIKDMPPFYVDELIEKSFKINDSNVNVRIEPGQYEFDPKIGVNGGYKIKLN